MDLLFVCILISMQVLIIVSLPPPLDSFAYPVVDGLDTYGIGDDLPELQIPQPMEKEPIWISGPNPPGLQETIQERLQSRLSALKAQYEALNETEKADIKAKAVEMRGKMALMPPPPPLCPPPEECDCDDEHFTSAYFPSPHPWWMRPRPPQHDQYFPRFQPGQFENSFVRPMHGPMNSQTKFPGHPLAQNTEKMYADSASVSSEIQNDFPINHLWQNNSPDASLDQELHRSKRDLSRLRQTFSVTNPNEWWQVGGPADRIFGYNPDFNRGDWHAFKYKPRGQFQQYQNQPLDYFKNLKYLPAGAEFYYNPNPALRPALTGVSVNPAVNSVYSDKFLSQNTAQSLPRDMYKLEWIQLVPAADKTTVKGFNMVLKNSQTGEHFRLNNADVNQFQGASPFRQQFNKVPQHWGGSGLAQGPVGSVYDHGPRYNDYYGTPHFYNRWSSICLQRYKLM